MVKRNLKHGFNMVLKYLFSFENQYDDYERGSPKNDSWKRAIEQMCNESINKYTVKIALVSMSNQLFVILTV